jgi:hypothetical protein
MRSGKPAAIWSWPAISVPWSQVNVSHAVVGRAAMTTAIATCRLGAVLLAGT